MSDALPPYRDQARRLKRAPQAGDADAVARLHNVIRAERLKIALFYGQHWVVDKLLGDDPRLPTHNLGLQIALYDEDAVRAALAVDPAVATIAIGPRRPILHLAFAQHHHAAPEKRGATMAIADMLLAAGADSNDDESLYHATEAPSVDGMALLMRFGVRSISMIWKNPPAFGIRV